MEQKKCPECESTRVKENGHNEYICDDCGNCFYIAGANIKRYGARTI